MSNSKSDISQKGTGYTNKDYADAFEQEMHSSYINKLFWISGSMESAELKEFIDDLDEDTWKEMMPDLYTSEYFCEFFNDGEMMDMLLGKSKFGFLAEVQHPTHTGFVFDKDGRFSSCEVQGWRCRLSYVYAETIDELTKAIKQHSDAMYLEMIEQDRTK